jgi:hypothetical protein
MTFRSIATGMKRNPFFLLLYCFGATVLTRLSVGPHRHSELSPPVLLSQPESCP